MSARNVVRQFLEFFNEKETATLKGGGTVAYDPTAVKLTTGGALALDLSAGVVTLGVLSRPSQTRQIGTRAKVGTTSGVVVGAANNLGTIATVPASQTAATMVIPVDGLKVGDTITGFKINGCINSAGGAVTVDANLRKLTPAAAAGGTDASVGSITQVSVSAATLMAAAKTGLSEVVATGVTYYILVTITTAGSTTVEFEAAEITVTEV